MNFKYIFALAFVLFVSSLFSATVTVTSDEDAMDAPLGTLRWAINTANDGDTIVFNESLSGHTIQIKTCSEAGGDGSLVITNKSLTIEGPSGGITIDGRWNGTYSSDSGTRLFYITGDETTNVFKRITFYRGHGRRWHTYQSDPLGGYYPSGAVRSEGAVRFYDCQLVKNSFSYSNSDYIGGGAVYAAHGIEAYNTSFLTNSLPRGEQHYGAVTVGDGGAIFSNCVFRGSYCGSYGGAITIFDGSLIIRDSVFEDNYSANSGADVFVRGATMQGGHSMLAENTVFRGATCNAGMGGSIYLEGSSSTFPITLVNCEFYRCSTKAAGGVIRTHDKSEIRAINSSFIDASGTDWGPALDCRAMAYFVNCTFTGTADLGFKGTNQNACVILFNGNSTFVNCIELCNICDSTRESYGYLRGIGRYNNKTPANYINSIINNLGTDRTTPIDPATAVIFADPFESRSTVSCGGTEYTLYQSFGFPVLAADPKHKYRSRVIMPARGGLLDGTGYPVKVNADYSYVAYSSDDGANWTTLYGSADPSATLITTDQRGVPYHGGHTPIGAATTIAASGMIYFIR